MKKLFADTNIFIRFLIGDNPEQLKQAKKYFQLAKDRKIQIVILSEILIEINHVLNKVYGISKSQIAEKLSELVRSEYFEVEDRKLWIRIFDLYPKMNIDLVDILLFEMAKSRDGEVLSFDKDFKRLKAL